MAQETPEQSQKAVEAFSTFLELVEASLSLPEQQARTVVESVPDSSALTTAGQALAEIIHQVLHCKYVGVFALDPPDDRQRLLGVSGLNPEEAQLLRQATSGVPLLDYVDAQFLEQLKANQTLLLDLKYRGFTTPRPTFGARYRLAAPMILHGQLIGFFSMAKADSIHLPHQSIFTAQEIMLAGGIAQLTAMVIEQVCLIEEWAKSHANELALEEINRRYDAFLSIACHELRTPLTSIKGNMQLMQRRLQAWKRQQETDSSLSPAELLERLSHNLEQTIANVNKLDRMTAELLDVSRVQAKKLVITLKDCNVRDIVEQTVETVQQTEPDRQIQLSLPPAVLVPVLADADRIAQVIINYLTNALKYAPRDRPIKVHLSINQEQDLVRLSVHDEGPGLTPAEQERIWERFYRSPDVQILNTQGSDANLGLGLNLCHEIIAGHHGQVGVQSMPGQGATFWFTLPLNSHTSQFEQHNSSL
jgi:signal transduction histidine kinase